MFVDKVKIFVKAGNGGNGRVSFLSAKFVPNGGPDGGDGGKGGDIAFVATKDANTLNEFYYTKHFRADNGENGDTRNCYGKQGNDKIISVPVGTIIRDGESGSIIADMFEDGQRCVVLMGGKGGKGNYHFATSRRQAPNFSQHGEKTIERQIILELKTIADVGLVGFPNVGKSTMLSVVSSAKPKIANYHFTTLSPNLGMVSHYETSFLMADIPGLIEGASDGAGLGHEFLRHIERTRVIVHVLDMSGSENRDPIEDFKMINKELKSYSEVLAKRPMLVVANKMDLPNAEENLIKFEEKFGKKYKIFKTTTIIHDGLKPVLDEIVKQLAKLPPISAMEFEPFTYEAPSNMDYEIFRLDTGEFVVDGGLVTDLIRKITLDDEDSFRYFQKVLRKQGVIADLRRKGAKDGDVVIVGEVEFDFVD